MSTDEKMDSKVVGSIKTVGSTFKWEIKNFSSIKADTGTVVYSPLCSTTDSTGQTLHWRLQLYPNGTQEDSANYLSVFLQNMSEIKVSATFSVSLLADSDIEIVKHKTISSSDMHHESWCGWPKFEKRAMFTDERICALLNDTLIVYCVIYSTSVTVPVTNKQLNEEEGSKVLNHFERLLETGDLSDVTFFIGNESLKLHKAILGTLSVVFHSMFNTDDEQNNTVKQVKLTMEISFDVMKEMFRYIYARKVNDIKSVARDLFVAAYKYQIEGLKVLCEETLCSNLNVDNALSCLELAAKYKMLRLTPIVAEFVVKQLKSFLAKEQFKKLSSDSKDLLLNIIADKLEIQL